MVIGKGGSVNDALTQMAFGSLAIYERVLNDAQIAKAFFAGTQCYKVGRKRVCYIDIFNIFDK